MLKRLALFSAILLALATSVAAEDWPGWRGPHGDGTSTEGNLPIRWSATENVAWKVAIPGKGHSSPIVSGDRIFLTTCLEKDGKRLLLCLDRRYYGLIHKWNGMFLLRFPLVKVEIPFVPIVVDEARKPEGTDFANA